MLAVKTDSEKGGEGMELTVQVPKHAQEILGQLNNHGFEAYVVCLLYTSDAADG